jgi:PAS domain S-box-containing protein
VGYINFNETPLPYIWYFHTRENNAMISVLYVDDETSLLEIGRIYLERAGGIAVETTTSAVLALELIKAGQYDVVVSDYQMPDMDGIAFLKILRQTHPELPFIIFTGRGREDVAIDAFESGADFYLQKGGAPRPQFAELAKKIVTAYEHRRGESRICTLNRLYSVLSATNKAIVRHNSTADLLSDICRIVVETGGFRMAWIGSFDPATHAIRPIASYGHIDRFFDEVKISGDDIPQGRGPTGVAFRTGAQEICNNIEEEPRLATWFEASRKRGYKAIAAFPFITSRGIWVLTLFAPETGFFDEQITGLLREMTRDLTHALKALDDEEERRRSETALAAKNEELLTANEQLTAQEEELRQSYDELKHGEDALRESEEKYRQIVETANEGIWTMDARFSTTFVNRRLSEMLGYSMSGMTGKNIQDFMSPDELADHSLRMQNRMAGKSERYERRFTRKDGSTCWLLVSVTPILTGQGTFKGSFAMLTDITGLKNAEERLSRNEAKFRHIFDTAPNLIISVNREGLIVDCNSRPEEVLGYGRGELIGKPASAIVHPDQQGASQVFFREILGTGSVLTRMFRIVKKDGSTIDASVNASGIRDKAGSVFRVVCILQDITEREHLAEKLRMKNEDLAASFEELTAIEEELRHHHDELLQNEQALRESEARYRNIFENAILGIFRTTPEGKIVAINRAFAGMFGYSSPDEMKSTVTDIRQLYPHPEDRDRIGDLLACGKPVRGFDIEFYHRDGHHIWISLNFQGICNTAGDVIFYEGTTEDITERRLAEAALLEKTRLLDTLLHNLPGMSYRCLNDPDRTMEFVSDGSRLLTGYDPGEFIDKGTVTYGSLIVPENQERVRDQIQSGIGARQPFHMEYRIRDAAGRIRWVWEQGQGVFADNGALLALEGYITDITHDRLAQEALETSNKKLQLLATVTRHDIVNQLGALRAYLELSLDDEQDAMQREMIVKEKKIVEIIEEQVLFTRDYQTVGMEVPVWQSLNANLIRATHALSLGKVQVDSHIPDIDVRADPLFAKVFLNLIDNSLRYGGETMDRIRVSCKKTEAGLMCIYEDNGMGIAPGDKNRLFNRGFGKHTGLGLFLVREILLITGITIRETGEYTRGARFEIAVPKDAFRPGKKE